MRNKLVITVLITSLAFGLIACKPDVDVLETCHTMAETNMKGAYTLYVNDGLTLSLEEYSFSDDGNGKYTFRAFGEGISSNTSFNFTYLLGDYSGLYSQLPVSITGGPDGVIEGFWGANTLFLQDTIAYTKTSEIAQVKKGTLLDADFEKVISAFPNTNWVYQDSTLWIRSIPKDSLKRDSVWSYALDEDGNRIKKQNGGDSTIRVEKIDTIYYIQYDTIGVQTRTNIAAQFNRDAKYVNTGSYYFNYQELKCDSVAITDADSTYFQYFLSENIDSVSMYNFHWGLQSITSSKKFVTIAVKDAAQKDTIRYSFSNFDKSKKKITLDGRDLKLQ